MNANTESKIIIRDRIDRKKIKDFFSQNAIYIVLASTTIRDIMLQSSTRAIIALGAAFVLITVGVDLSAGRVVGLTAVLSASMLQVADYSRRFYPDIPDLPLWLPVFWLYLQVL